MLADILIKGTQLSGGDGWFTKAVVQTRFDAKAVRAALDKNGDGVIARTEFSGPDADFTRLDRDRDGSLTPADFDFKTQPSSPSPAALLFSRADQDGNGKLTRQELDLFFQNVDSGGAGFLSQSDLQEAFAGPSPTMRDRTGGPGSLTRGTFLKSLVRRELGAFPPGPALNEKAPDFTLRTVDGSEEIALSKVVGPKPVVLIFGNVTCGPFRGQAGNLEKLYRRYKDRVTFLMVYVREAHPTDGWRMVTNDRVGIALSQPRTYRERVSAAQVCNKTMSLGFPMLVDTLDDTVNNLYSGIPSRLYIIDRTGKIAFKSGRGPFGFKPAELEHSLILLLNHDASNGTPVAAQTRQLSDTSRVHAP